MPSILFCQTISVVKFSYSKWKRSLSDLHFLCEMFMCFTAIESVFIANDIYKASLSIFEIPVNNTLEFLIASYIDTATSDRYSGASLNCTALFSSNVSNRKQMYYLYRFGYSYADTLFRQSITNLRK